MRRVMVSMSLASAGRLRPFLCQNHPAERAALDDEVAAYERFLGVPVEVRMVAA